MPEEPQMGGAEQMPMGAPEGQPEVSPEGAPEGEQEEPQPEKEQDSAERVQTMVERLKKAQEASDDPDRYKTALERAEKLQEKLKETGEDGGPGSGPKPGYHKNGSSLIERAKFMADPTEGLPEPKRAERTHESVQKANQERKEWSDLTMHQKIAGNAAQERHIAKVKKQVMKAAAKGDLEKARKIVKANRHYWSNDPDSDMKVQSETLERQKAEEPGFLRRVDIDPQTDYNKDDVAGDFNPYHDEDGKFSSKNGAVMNGAHWAANEESVKVAGPTKSREYTKSYIAKHPKVAKMAEKLKHVRSMVQNFAKDHPDAEEGTYSATTGKPVEDMKGFCVTFHQNLAKDDPFGGYTDDDYAEMCAVAMDELGCSDVNIGYFGNPEVSFTCEDPQKAMDFAIKHNQHSIFNTNNFKTMKNPYYRKSLNPIEGH